MSQDGAILGVPVFLLLFLFSVFFFFWRVCDALCVTGCLDLLKRPAFVTGTNQCERKSNNDKTRAHYLVMFIQHARVMPDSGATSCSCQTFAAELGFIHQGVLFVAGVFVGGAQKCHPFHMSCLLIV